MGYSDISIPTYESLFKITNITNGNKNTIADVSVFKNGSYSAMGWGPANTASVSGGSDFTAMPWLPSFPSLSLAFNTSSTNKTSSTGSGMSSANAGNYAGVSLSQEQVNNAKIISDVGKSMGMSQRDIQTAIMTAMQESGLRNIDYGDRDSVGLFQQRPSCGWGTVAQCTNPAYAATKFFEHLKNVKDRNSLSLNDAAYKVQRCAAEYKDRYGNWENMAGALLA
ncbi:MAG: hypothetical protein PHC34_10315 [Candidatus Gastranaerophilales bacterium]|nr:hypothetical protein [Candidatus Gastranaerophilales bacterium]